MLKAYFWFRQVMVREDGQGMTEYGLIIALVAVALIVILGSLGDGLKTTFGSICKAVTGAECKM